MRNRSSRRLATSCAIIIAAGAFYTALPFAVAQTAAAPMVPVVAAPLPGELACSIERAIVFKDGYTLIAKRAVGTIGADGGVFTRDLPEAAVLGCFWATSDQAAIKSMRAEWIEETSQRERVVACVTVLDLLRANVKKRVVLTAHAPTDPQIVGVIAEILEQPVSSSHDKEKPVRTVSGPFAANPDFPNRAPNPAEPASLVNEVIRDMTPTGAQFVAIDQEDGIRVIYPVANIRSISGAGLVTAIRRTEEVTTRRKQLTFQLAPIAAGAKNTQKPLEPGANVQLNLFYFTPGIRWIPTYRVNADQPEPGKAEIALQAELLNELEDLESTQVDLVVGVPSFRFKNVISPLSLETELRDALRAAAPQLMGASGQMSNALFSQRSGEYTSTHAPISAGGSSPLALAPELVGGAGDAGGSGGVGEQDLYLYSLGSFTLKRGARAAVPLWTAAAPSKQVFSLDLRIARDRNNGDQPEYAGSSAWLAAQSRSGFGANSMLASDSPLRFADGRVWRQLELTNQSSTPWTTGAALLMRGLVPLGQDILTYTPVNACTLLPVTVAVDVQSAYKEEELERTPNVLNWNNYSYFKVRKRAVITLSNFRKEKSDMRVRLSLGGKVETASDDGAITLNDYRPDDWGQSNYEYRPNNHSDVSWNFTLEPGATKTLTVELMMYAR